MRRSAITKCGPKSRLRATGVGEDQLLAEALHGDGFVVVHVENRHELGHLQHLFEFRAQIAKLERPALRSGAVKRRHQRSHPALSMYVTFDMFKTIFLWLLASRPLTRSRKELLSSPKTIRPSRSTTVTPLTSRSVILSAT